MYPKPRYQSREKQRKMLQVSCRRDKRMGYTKNWMIRALNLLVVQMSVATTTKGSGGSLVITPRIRSALLQCVSHSTKSTIDNGNGGYVADCVLCCAVLCYAMRNR
jgi:hypothetical protein